MSDPVAVPRRAAPTVFCTPIRSGMETSPKPAPIRTVDRRTTQPAGGEGAATKTTNAAHASAAPAVALSRNPIRRYKRLDDAAAIGQLTVIADRMNPAATAP